MSHTNIKSTTAGGTQSPPLEDSHPLGASSIKGGNAGGVPDREQRSQYFDEPAQPNPVESVPTASDAVRGQPIDLDALEPAHDPQPASLFETAPTASGPFKKMSDKDIRSATRA
ncbi:hypothetical protein BC834DRAFT_969594 [Gloeopeniophorella convolvens]|nr:hypothetical protein BC834DRAFT_969594 [Gloeopeniophorella convolvens]